MVIGKQMDVATTGLIVGKLPAMSMGIYTSLIWRNADPVGADLSAIGGEAVVKPESQVCLTQ